MHPILVNGDYPEVMKVCMLTIKLFYFFPSKLGQEHASFRKNITNARGNESPHEIAFM